MTQITIEELKMKVRRRTANHEAGHLTAALALGIEGRAWLFDVEGADVWQSTTCLGKMEATCYPPSVAVAGVVATCCFEEPEIDSWSIAEYIRLEVVTPSSTDLANFPADEKLEETIEEALVLLKKHKKFFDWGVAQLIEVGSITNGQARDQFDEFEDRPPAWKSVATAELSGGKGPRHDS